MRSRSTQLAGFLSRLPSPLALARLQHTVGLVSYALDQAAGVSVPECCPLPCGDHSFGWPVLTRTQQNHRPRLPAPSALGSPAGRLGKPGNPCVLIVWKVGTVVTAKSLPGVRVVVPELVCGHRCFGLKENSPDEDTQNVEGQGIRGNTFLF